MTVEKPTLNKSARFVTDKRSAELGQETAQKVEGASYEVICEEGTFSTSPNNSFALSENQVGVILSINDYLSEIRYDRFFRNLRSKTTE